MILLQRDQVTANIYTKFMSKIIEKGSFVNQELARLNKLLKQGKLNEKKKTELSNKINILKSFRPPKTELWNMHICTLVVFVVIVCQAFAFYC